MSSLPPSRWPSDSIQPETITVTPIAPAWGVWRGLAVLALAGGASAAAILFLVPPPGAGTEIATAPSTIQAARPAVEFPVRCAPGSSVTLEDLTHRGQGTLIEAEAGCRVVIRRSSLSAQSILSAKDQSDVTIEASVLESTSGALSVGAGCRIRVERTRIDSGDVALKASDSLKLSAKELTVRSKRGAIEAGSLLDVELDESDLRADDYALKTGFGAKVSLKNDSRLQSAERALDSGAHLELHVEKSSLRGGKTTLTTATNATIQLTGAELDGGQRALVSDGNLDLTMTSSRIAASAIALCSGPNAKLRARSSSLTATLALKLQEKPAPFVVEDTRISGETSFEARGCSLSGEAALPEAKAAVIEVASQNGVPFDYERAQVELDRATRLAATVCHARAGSSREAIVVPDFEPDGTNRGVKVRNASDVGTATECVLHYFKRVRVPAFDAANKPKELLRVVALKE